MSGSSSIEWTDATWNPVRGCSRVSEGCRNCYAERQAARFVKPGQPFHGFAQATAPRDDLDRVGRRRNGWTGKVELVPSELDWPMRWRGDKRARAEGRPSRVFVNSMSDLFHERLSDEDIAAVFGVMAACPQHVFQVLTKRPERMRKWFEWIAGSGAAFGCVVRARDYGVETGWPIVSRGKAVETNWPLPNVWIGVSVENQATADERIPLLLRTPAAVRFVSYEPAIGEVDFEAIEDDPGDRIIHSLLGGFVDAGGVHPGAGPRLDWLIVGGESGPGARPFDLEWARSAVEQCRAAGTACFVKQLGANRAENGRHDPGHTASLDRVRDRKGSDWSERPEDLRVREFPGGGR